METVKTIAYFDVGTSNMRLYFLDQDCKVLYTDKKTCGAKDAALANDRHLMIRRMKELYQQALDAFGCTDEEIEAIYASGMVTSRYGILEVPHVKVPVTDRDLAKATAHFYDPEYFSKEIRLIPGLKAEGASLIYTNNVRGEEIECFGAMEALAKTEPVTDAAMIFPGSHTHILYIRQNQIVDILSTFTGELFYALQQETMLGDLLKQNISVLDPLCVRMGRKTEQELGFNRAMYICNTMQVFHQYTPEQQFSYAEGVIHSGVIEALEHNCAQSWKDCHTVVLACNEFQYQLYAALLEGNPYIHKVIWLPLTREANFAVRGLKRIIENGG